MEIRTKQKLVLMVFLCCAGVGLSIWQSQPLPVGESEAVQVKQPLVQEERQVARVTVYVSGAVVKPGLYEVEKNARATKAIELAGGFLPEANQEKVNLAKRCKDGMQINVPRQKEKTSAAKRVAPAAQSTAPVRAGSVSVSVTTAGAVSINSASAAELETLPGVGPAMAERIISYRTQHPFQSVTELQKVAGIGAKKYQQLAARICL